MKRIVEINILNETGSTGRIMQGIADVLQKSEKYEVYTAYGYGSSNKDNSLRIGNKFSYIIHNIGSKLLCNQGCYSKWSTKDLIKFLDEKKIDLIHLHNIHGNYLNYTELFNYIKQNNIPVIWTLHDCWAFTGKCTHFDFCNCMKWKTQCYDCPIIKEYPTSYFIDKSREYYKLKKECFTNVKNMFIVTPSKWLANLVEESFLKKYPLYVINNGINLHDFYPKTSKLRDIYKLNNKKIILGVASPWTQNKGFKDFIKLSNLVSDDYVIVMIGVNDKQVRILPKNIIGIKRTENVGELAEWYSIADVFVNTTYEDNFPTVNLESLACNTPVITYDTGGSVEVINENTGLICKKGNIEELYRCITLICDNKEKYLHCSTYARFNYDEINNYKKYLDLYNSIFEEVI